jgi:hypothetical protein
MSAALSAIAGMLLKLGAALIVINEVRGLVLTAPVFYAMYEAGGTLMAVWLGVCSLAGIGLSVVVPMLALKRFQRLLNGHLVS